SYRAGVEAEESALQELDLWLAGGKPAPVVLRRLLDELNRHAAQTPPPLDCLQTECFRAGGLLDLPLAWPLQAEDGGRVRENWLIGGIALSLERPWENERKTRLWRAVWEGLFRTLRTPHWQVPDTAEATEARKDSTRAILRGWLPGTEGPGASL